MKIFDIFHCQPLIILTSGQNIVRQECRVVWLGGGIKFLSWPGIQQNREENRPTVEKHFFFLLAASQPGVIFCREYWFIASLEIQWGLHTSWRSVLETRNFIRIFYIFKQKHQFKNNQRKKSSGRDKVQNFHPFKSRKIESRLPKIKTVRCI